MPVLGVPGSSQMGAAVTGAGVYAGGAASSRSGMALLIEPDGSLDSMTLPSGAPPGGLRERGRGGERARLCFRRMGRMRRCLPRVGRQ